MTDITRAEAEALLAAVADNPPRVCMAWCGKAKDECVCYKAGVAVSALNDAAPALAHAYLVKCDEVDAAHADIDTLRKCAAEEMVRAEAAAAEVKRLTAELRGKTFTVDEGREATVRAEAAEAALALRTAERNKFREMHMNACEPIAASPDIQDVVTAVEEWVNRRGGEETADQIAIMAIQAHQRALLAGKGE